MKNHDSNEHAQNEPISGEIYHVTPTRNLESIFRKGLRPQIGPRSELLGAVDRSGLHLVSDVGYELACLRLVPPENISLAFQDHEPAVDKNGQVTEGTS